MRYLLASLIACAALSLFPGAAAQETTTLWYPYAEWSFSNPSWSGNPFDLQARAVFSDGRHPHLFYDGGTTWKLRYMCTEAGTFTFTTTSSDHDLDGLSGSVTCQDNPGAMGLLTSGGDGNSKFYVRGWERAIVPAWVMIPGISNSVDGVGDSVIDEWIQNNIDDAGFMGAHTSGPSNCWYDWGCSGTRSDCTSNNPDPVAFREYEELMDKLYQKGAFIHIWLFADCQSNKCDKFHDDIAGQERMRHYMADRWGAIPNWMIGEGYDNYEDDDTAYANKLFNDINDRIAWPHLIGMRAGPNTFSDICTECNYHSYENTPDDWTYSRFCNTYDQGTDRPTFEEDRFRYRPDNPRSKDIEGLTDQRRWMWWQAMSGGVGGIYGYMVDRTYYSSDVGGYPSDWEETIKAWHDFWYETPTEGFHRFMPNMERCNSLTNGYALCDQDGNYVFYRENTNYITFDVSALTGNVHAKAMDTKTGYFIDLGNVDSSYSRFDAPYSSDWAVGIGIFAAAECGDGECQASETCSACPEDCGPCEHHWLEAEYPDTLTSPMQTDSNSAASEGGYIHVPNGAGTGGEATYDVGIMVPGSYVLWGRVNTSDGEDDSFFIEIESSGEKLWDVQRGTAWLWDQVSDRYSSDPVIFTLISGVLTITVKQREDGTMLDKLLLTNDLSYTPSGLGEPAENIHQGCPCTSPYICCEEECVLPACTQDSDCGPDPCTKYTCSSPGTCSASCSSMPVTACTSGDGCCPSGCESQDSDCSAMDCTGLVLHHRYDNDPEHGESLTHVHDYSGEGNHGTVTGATPTGGLYGGAFSFDRLNPDFITSPDIPEIGGPGSTELSAAAWVWPDDGDGGTIVCKWDDSGTGKSFLLNILYQSTGEAIASVHEDDSSGTDYMDIFSDSPIASGEWTHLAFTFRAGIPDGLRMYVNGVLQPDTKGTEGIPYIEDNNIPLTIGTHYGASGAVRPFDGLIDDLSVWNRTLTSQEIQDLATSGLPLTCHREKVHECDTNPQDGCVRMTELSWYIQQWHLDSTAYPMWELMEAVALYYDPADWCP